MNLVSYVIFAAILVAIALAWPAYSRSRAAVWRETCRKNFEQIGLALNRYHEQYGCFPPAYFADEQGRPMHSWRVLLLPFLGQAQIYNDYRFDEPWDGPNNRRLADRTKIYSCPAENAKEGSPEAQFTSYVAVVGPGTAWPGATSVTRNDFHDEPICSLHLAEIARSGIHWMEPRDLNVEKLSLTINPKDGEGISSRHPGGAHVLLGEGGVRFAPDTLSEGSLQALLKISDGNPPRDEF